MELHRIEYLLKQVKILNNRYEKINQQSGENFNIFKILRLEASEVRLHSTFIAELLNPKGSHGQKEVFLNLFISEFGAKEKEFDPTGAHTEVEKSIGTINAEKTKGGRIDILVTDGKGKHILIENKIYASDQEKQLIRYKNYSKLSDLFYLTLDGKKPDAISCEDLEEGKDYKCLSYKQHIAKWINLCIKEVALTPIIRESLIQYLHLIKYLNNQTINRSMSEELSALLNSNLEAAFTIKNNLSTAMRTLLKKLKSDVESLEEEFSSLGFSCNYYVNIDNRYSGFRFFKREFKYVGMTFQFSDYGEYFTYGIASIDDPIDKPIPQALREELENLVGTKHNDIWWPIKLKFEEPYNKNWKTSFEPWEAIENGKLKIVIREKLKHLIELTKNVQL